MSASYLPLLLLLPALMVASAFFSGAETALFSLGHADRVRLRRLSPAAARATGALLANPRALLVSILLLNNVVNVMFFVVSSVLASHLDEELPAGSAGLAAVGFSVGSVLALVMFSEVLPKMLARRLRVEFCRLLAPLFLVLHRTVGPIRAFLDRGLVGPLARLVTPSAALQPPAVTIEELSALLEVSAREGAIETQDQHLLEDVVELSTIRVRDVMTPRIDMPWLDAQAPPEEVTAEVGRSGRPLLPVCDGSPDRVLGWLDAKRYFAARLPEGPTPRPVEHLRPVLYVPERARLDQLLELFRQSRRYAAVCVDEYGTVVGIIEIEDVLRQLVAPAPQPGGTARGDVERLGEGRWRVPGRMRVRELAEFFTAPGVAGRLDRSVSTVGGLVLMSLGRVPRVGESVRLGNIVLAVDAMDGRAVDRVLVSLSQPEEAAA